MAFCEECGNQLSDQTKFCSKCGTAVIQEFARPPFAPSTEFVATTDSCSADYYHPIGRPVECELHGRQSPAVFGKDEKKSTGVAQSFRNNRKWLSTTGAVILILFCMAWFFGESKPTWVLYNTDASTGTEMEFNRKTVRFLSNGDASVEIRIHLDRRSGRAVASTVDMRKSDGFIKTSSNVCVVEIKSGNSVSCFKSTDTEWRNVEEYQKLYPRIFR